MAKSTRSKANIATKELEGVEEPIDTNLGLSEYEKKRQANIAERKEFFEYLGIQKDKDELIALAHNQQNPVTEKRSTKSNHPVTRKTRSSARLEEQSANQVLPSEGSASTLSTPTASPYSNHPLTRKTRGSARLEEQSANQVLPSEGSDRTLSIPIASPSRQSFEGFDNTMSTPTSSPESIDFEGFGIDSTSTTSPSSPAQQYPFWTFPLGIKTTRSFIYKGKESFDKGWFHPDYPPENPEYSNYLDEKTDSTFVRICAESSEFKIQRSSRYWRSEKHDCTNCDDSYHKIRKVMEEERRLHEKRREKKK